MICINDSRQSKVHFHCRDYCGGYWWLSAKTLESECITFSAVKMCAVAAISPQFEEMWKRKEENDRMDWIDVWQVSRCDFISWYFHHWLTCHRQFCSWIPNGWGKNKQNNSNNFGLTRLASHSSYHKLVPICIDCWQFNETEQLNAIWWLSH